MTTLTGGALITSTSSQNVVMIDPATNVIKQITMANFQNAFASPFSEDLTSVTTSSNTETTFRNYVISSNRMYVFNASGNWIGAATSTTGTVRFYFNGVNIYSWTGTATSAAGTLGWEITIRVQKISNTEAQVTIEGSVNGAGDSTVFGTAENITGVNFSGIAFVVTGQVSNASGSLTIKSSDALAYP